MDVVTTLNDSLKDDQEDDSIKEPTIFSYILPLMYVMYISITVLAVGGNGILCYIVLAYQKMRTVTNFFIMNLAVGDILMACLCIPFSFVANFITYDWPFGEIMCPVMTYAQAVTVFISAYTMVAISIDRYIAIIYPLRPRMTKIQALVTIFIVWIVALVTPLPTAIYSTLHQIEPDVDVYVCREIWTSEEHYYHYSIILTVLQYVVPLVTLIFTYARIAVVIWWNRAPGEAEDSRDRRLAASKRKMIKMMITVVIIFTLCWLPFNILMALGTKDGDFWKLPGMLYIWFVCHWLAMSHACYNPIIYCWMNARFRNGFRYVFRRLLCSRSMISKKRWDDDNSLKRCNTYTTSCTSVRPTSIQGVGSHSAMKSNRDSHSHVKNVKPSELISLRDSHYNSAHRDENGDDEDPTSETHI